MYSYQLSLNKASFNNYKHFICVNIIVHLIYSAITGNELQSTNFFIKINCRKLYSHVIWLKYKFVYFYNLCMNAVVNIFHLNLMPRTENFPCLIY